MRIRSLLLLLMVAISISGTNKTIEPTGFLDGTWIPVKQEIGGQAIPEARFEKQQLTIADSQYIFIAESTDKGVLSYRAGRMDIYCKEGVNAGRHITAIYAAQNGQLVVCYNLAGNGYPETFETTGKPLYFLSVFRKATGR